MTRDEAIRILKYNSNVIHKTINGETDPNEIEALDMAIKALEAQEWVPVNKKSHPDTPIRVQVQLDNGWIITAYYEENEWLSVPDFGEPIQDKWIEAWRPLPEEYREEDIDE